MDGIEIRAARRDDSFELLRWRNDPATVRASVSRAAVQPAEHASWLDGVLTDPDRTLLVGELDGRPFGTCRFDLHNSNVAEVSINLAPEARGRGLSRPLLAVAIDHYRRDRSVTLTAVVRVENEASLRLFSGLAFVETGRDAEYAHFERRATATGATRDCN